MRPRLRALLPRLHVLPALNGRPGWTRETRDAVLDGARIEVGETVADVAAGTGLLTLGAAERVGADGDVLALDVSVDALEELRATAEAPNISYLLGQADVLPLPDASIDVVVTRSVLNDDDKAEVARELARVLRSGGRASLFEPMPNLAESDLEGVFVQTGLVDVRVTGALLTARKP